MMVLDEQRSTEMRRGESSRPSVGNEVASDHATGKLSAAKRANWMDETAHQPFQSLRLRSHFTLTRSLGIEHRLRQPQDRLGFLRAFSSVRPRLCQFLFGGLKASGAPTRRHAHSIQHNHKIEKRTLVSIYQLQQHVAGVTAASRSRLQNSAHSFIRSDRRPHRLKALGHHLSLSEPTEDELADVGDLLSST